MHMAMSVSRFPRGSDDDELDPETAAKVAKQHAELAPVLLLPEYALRRIAKKYPKVRA